MTKRSGKKETIVIKTDKVKEIKKKARTLGTPKPSVVHDKRKDEKRKGPDVDDWDDES